MLDEAFLHFKGIGKKKLEQLKAKNISNWNQAIFALSESGNSIISTKDLLEQLQKCSQAAQESDIQYLVNTFHPQDKWRLLYHYFEELTFFDIETDGEMNRITVIVALHKGKLFRFIRNENLNEFLDFLEDVKLLVSFNGGSFDVPVVLRHFHIPEFPSPHIDLRWVVYHLGWKGGLKKLEDTLSIPRPKDLIGIDGLEAVFLWIKWIDYKDHEAKEKLIRYCSADVISLYYLTLRVLKFQNPDFEPPTVPELWALIDNQLTE